MSLLLSLSDDVLIEIMLYVVPAHHAFEIFLASFKKNKQLHEKLQRVSMRHIRALILKTQRRIGVSNVSTADRYEGGYVRELTPSKMNCVIGCDLSGPWDFMPTMRF